MGPGVGVAVGDVSSAIEGGREGTGVIIDLE